MRDLVDELLQAQVKAKLFGTVVPVMLGRWELRERLGAGAMGTVFAAHDPTLQRDVAIKVLRRGTDRLLAEARALAKLQHPNVVAVHDAGELDGVVYLVMELVTGERLGAWARNRPWREVMRAGRDAAQGLSAAHDAGLIHRDIKPDNIVVGGDRARILDFGLAQSGDDGSSAGTPVYMAPEVKAGKAATPASDQYSFGVTLFEALYGVRPTASAKAPSSNVPAWVHTIVHRMLAPDPADRFASMREVVRALKRDHRRVRFAMILTGTAIVGAGLGAWTMHRGSQDTCGDAPVHRNAVWNASTRAGVKSGLGGAPWAARTLDAFDAASRGWELSYRTVCEATRVHGSQSDALLQLRMRCLDRNLDRLGALAAALAGNKEGRALPDAPAGEARYALDPTALVSAPAAVVELPAAADCEHLVDATELALPADPQQRQRARDVEHELDRGWAAFALGRYRDAKEIASHARGEVDKLEAPVVRAAALVLAASVTARIGAPADAHTELQAALDATAAAHATTLQLDVWARMLRSELFAGDPAKVIEYAPFARAAAALAGRSGAELDGIVAEAERDAGHLAEAKQLLEHALGSTDPLRPDQRALLELNLGSVELALGDSPAALATLTHARDRVISTFGDRHPDVALYDDKLASAHRARGEIRAALALHDQSQQLRTAAFGADDRAVATSLFHRSETELEAGELAKAEHSLHAAIAIREKVFGATSARLGELYAALARIDNARGTPAADHIAKAEQLDARLSLVAEHAEAGDPKPAFAVPNLTSTEPLSLARATALVARQHASLSAHVPGGVDEISAALVERYKPGMDPALVVAIAQASFITSPGKDTADLFASALANLGNEPNRTALEAAFGLAQCEDPRAGQAARTAISLYQAMPQLGRSGMPLIQELAKKP